MLNVPQVREQLATVLGGLVPPDVPVIRSAFDSVPRFPAVVLGMPWWDEGRDTTFCLPVLTWPIACVVARSGSNDTATVDQLDGLWPGLVEQLRRLGPAVLAGLAAQVIVGPARFGQFSVQGSDYPAQLLSIEIFG